MSIKLVAKAGSVFDRIITALVSGVGFLLVGVVVIVCLEVVMRYFFVRPLTWVVETSEYCIFWIAFLSAAWILKREGHVKVDLVVSRFSARSQALLNTIASIIGTAVCLTFVWYGTHSTWSAILMGKHCWSPMEPILWPIIMIIPIGSFLLFIQFLRRTQGYFGEWRSLVKERHRG